MTEEKKTDVVAETIQEQFVRDLANKKEELNRAELSLKEHEEILVLFEELLPLVEKSSDLYNKESCKVLKPIFAFEETEQYQELKAQQMKIENMQLYYNTKDKSVKGLRDTVEAKQKAIKDLKEKISNMEKE